MLEPRLLSRLEKKKNQLDALRPLPAAEVNHLREQLNLEWIYNSNAIEGSTLTLRETQLILETGLTIGEKACVNISRSSTIKMLSISLAERWSAA